MQEIKKSQHVVVTDMENHDERSYLIPVSYTHLDVYKRQGSHPWDTALRVLEF